MKSMKASLAMPDGMSVSPWDIGRIKASFAAQIHTRPYLFLIALATSFGGKIKCRLLHVERGKYFLRNLLFDIMSLIL